ncbi:MAG: hypothetical protein AB7O37_16835 [Vicinamibacteria bacterium]
MADDDAERRAIDNLAGRFAEASVVLFTGAGFSLGATNQSGIPPALASELKKELWRLSFPGDPFDANASLPDLYHAASTRHPRQLEELLARTYTVRSEMLPDWYATYFLMPWARSYTLNIDDLERAAARKFELPRPLRSISALAATPPVADEPGAVLDVVHLNGVVSDGIHGVTFSTSQYMQRISVPLEPWYIRVSVDLLSHPFVFVGTQLDEPPLWQHVEMRRHKGGRGTRELRPKSYLVTPTLDRARQVLLDDFNVVWLKMSSEEFAERILGNLRDAGRDGLAKLARLAAVAKGSGTLSQVADLSRGPYATTEFLLGQEPTWGDLQLGRAIARESDETLWSRIEVARARTRRGVVLITGTAGSGKSTALMRAVLRLSAAGTKVGWVDRDSDLSPRAIRTAMRGDAAPPVLAVDDADVYGPELSAMLTELALSDRAPLILVAIRSGRVEKALNPARMKGVPYEEAVMPGLSDRDIGGLLDLLDRENRLGVLKGKSRRDQEQVFRDKAGRQLLVAMIEATSNQRFEDKAVDELAGLEPEGQLIYALVAVASAHRIDLSREDVLIAVGDHSNQLLNSLDQLVRRKILVEIVGDETVVRARHRVIAEIIRDELARRGLLKEPLYGLALLAATKVRPGMRRNAKPWRLLRVVLNHDMLFKTLGRDGARGLYGSIEQALSWDYHYWLQRGSLEVESGDLDLAQNFLSQARSLAHEEDPLVENEWAYLLFKQAISDPSAADAERRAEEATAILLDMIARRGTVDSYPYHVLGSQGLSWVRRRMSSSVERERYLARLIKTTDEGLERHPLASDLKQLLADLRREYMSLAISKPN